MREVGSERSHSVAGAFVFLLLGVFAVFSTMLVVVGAQAYRSMTDASAQHNTARILHAYMLNNVRADDAEAVMSVYNGDAGQTLVIEYDYSGSQYEKRIYCYDGALREHFAAAGYEFEPEDGEVICEAEALDVQIDGNLMTVTLTAEDARAHTTQIALRATR